MLNPLVAKLDIAADSDSEGRGFESLRADHFLLLVVLRIVKLLAKPKKYDITEEWDIKNCEAGKLRKKTELKIETYKNV